MASGKLSKLERKEAHRKKQPTIPTRPVSPEHLKYIRRKKALATAWPIFRFLILFGLCFIILYPLIFMVSTAFRPAAQMNDPTIVWIPKSLTLQNMRETFEAMNLLTTVKSTLFLNIGCSILQVVTCAITGYGFARFNFKFKGLLFGIVIMMILVPPQITLIPIYMQYAYFDFFGIIKMVTGEHGNLINNPLTMYLPALFSNGLRSGLFILLFRQFFKGLPKELEDAAYLDGCGPFGTFIRVMVPNASSSFLTVFLFSVVWYWNDYYVSTSFFTNNQTISLMLMNLDKIISLEIFGPGAQVTTRETIVWLESGCLLSIIPLLILYVGLQKYFTEGIERSGLVG